LAVLDIFRDDGVVAANRLRASRWRQLLAPVAAHRAVRDFRQCGMIFAFEVATARADFAQWWFREALARELLVRPIGRTVYFMPPYIVTDDAMQMLATRTLDLLDRA
jgi:adenosylmethionine-8-amino-7-oxononanoate aminotransferase